MEIVFFTESITPIETGFVEYWNVKNSLSELLTVCFPETTISLATKEHWLASTIVGL